MSVHHTTITLTVADYCDAYNRNDVLIDRRYQRNAQVWPSNVQSYLIETILRGFPIPKFALHQKTDIRSRKTTKYIVDGQQRTLALLAFYNGDLRLSRSLDLEDARGCTLYELSPELQTLFLNHQLQFDQFAAASESVVREYFRRINSFTAPLNAEEKRNAEYQGNMKLLILRLAGHQSNTLVTLGTLTDRQVIRMADHKFFSEIIDALLTEVRTTDARKLNAMYREYDRSSIPKEKLMFDTINSAFDTILGWPLVRDTGLVRRTHIFYSLLLAVIAAKSQWPTLHAINPFLIGVPLSEQAESRLLELEDVLEANAPDGRYSSFVKACTEKTNTWDQRQERIRWFMSALCDA